MVGIAGEYHSEVDFMKNMFKIGVLLLVQFKAFSDQKIRRDID